MVFCSLPTSVAQAQNTCAWQAADGTTPSLASNSRYSDLVNQVTITAPPGITDTDASNNQDCDTNRVEFATIEIVKTVLGTTAASTDDFGFGVQNSDVGDFRLSHGQHLSWSAPPPNNATPIIVTESDPNGYVLHEINCASMLGNATLIEIGTDSAFDPGDTSVSINAFSGDHVACEFVNVTSSLSISKDDGSDTYTPGQTSTYQITLSNDIGGFTAIGVNLVDDLPVGASLASPPVCLALSDASCAPLDASDPCEPLTASGDPQQLVINDCARIEPGGSLVYAVEVNWDANLLDPGTGVPGPVTNTVTAHAATQLDTVSDSDTNQPLSFTDLSVQKTALDDYYVTGGQARFEIEVRNDGPSAAFGAQLSDTLPVGAQSLAWVCNDASSSAPCPTPTIGTGAPDMLVPFDLGVQQALVFEVTVQMTDGFVDTLTNTASIAVGPNAVDPQADNNSSTAQIGPAAPGFGDLEVIKSTPVSVIDRLAPVPYKIRVDNLAGRTLSLFEIADIMPAGFNYIEGTASVTRLSDGLSAAIEPRAKGRLLSWFVDPSADAPMTLIAPQDSLTIEFSLMVGGIVDPGSFTNRAMLFNSAGDMLAQESAAVVQVRPDWIDCPTVIGQVFWDTDADGVQDPGEEGVPGISLYDVSGTKVTVDRWGRYHLPCTYLNQMGAGNVILKLDEGTLPTGASIVSENPRVIYATPGRLHRMDFAIVRPQRIEVTLEHCAFVENSLEIRNSYASQFATLVELLNGHANPQLVLTYRQSPDEQASALGSRRLQGLIGRLNSALERQVNGESRLVTVPADQVPNCAPSLPLQAAAAPACPALPAIYFDFDSQELRADQREVLGQVANFLRTSPLSHPYCSLLSVEGHADEAGTDGYNLVLARRRAERVAAHLSQLGISPSQMQLNSFGESQPVLQSFVIEGPEQLNRRVQLRIVSAQ